MFLSHFTYTLISYYRKSQNHIGSHSALGHTLLRVTLCLGLNSLHGHSLNVVTLYLGLNTAQNASECFLTIKGFVHTNGVTSSVLELFITAKKH